MSALTLWYSPGACSLAPHILLHEAGSPFEAVSVALAEVTRAGGEIARLNPKRRVPVLRIGGDVVTEVPAIMTLIADRAPHAHLLGASPLERARAQEWMAWLAGALHGQGFGALFRPERFSDDPDHHAAIRAKGRATVAAGFEAIEDRLAGLHAVGDAFTAVDAYLLVFYRWGNGVGLPMAQAYPRYAALVRHLVERPAVRRALEAEGIAPLDHRTATGDAARTSAATERAA